jgi:GGDEF domain-containing protein
MRRFELAYRLGGEKFLVMLPGHDVATAQAVAEFIRGSGSITSQGERQEQGRKRKDHAEHSGNESNVEDHCRNGVKMLPHGETHSVGWAIEVRGLYCLPRPQGAYQEHGMSAIIVRT